MKTAAVILFFACSITQAKSLSITQYFRSPVRPGDSVCEPPLEQGHRPRCFVVLNWQQTITPDSDRSGRLRNGAISSGQGGFSEVNIRELLSSIAPEKLGKNTSVDVFVKVAWSGEKAGPLNAHLQDDDVVQGRLKLQPDGHFSFELISIRNLTIIGMFNPNLQTAQMFGRAIGKENFELENDVKLWMQDVLASVLPALFDSLAATQMPRRK